MRLFINPEINLREKLQNPENRKLLARAITNYLRAGVYDPRTLEILPRKGEVYISKGGEILVPPEPGAPFFTQKEYREIFKEEVPIDTQWAEIFRTVKSTKEGETYAAAQAAITFKQLKPGEKPELATLTGSEVYVPNLKWGAAFGFYKDWINDNAIWKIEDTIRSAKEAAYDALATFMYGLILNANFPTVSKSASDNSSEAWIKALNEAFAKLKRAKKLKPNQRPIVICPPEKRGYIDNAIADTQVKTARGPRLQLIPQVIDTAYFPSDANVRVVVPKRDFIYQEREALRSEEDVDIMLDAELFAWYFRCNGLIRDANAGVTIEES